MQITAALVKELRERTGAGMMECKRALVESKGDIEAAIEAMRISGQAKAAKKAARIAAEGLVAVANTSKSAAMVEINSETDFVAKSDEFKEFCNAVAERVLKEQPADMEALLALNLEGGMSIETRRKELIGKIGENLQIRRFVALKKHGEKLGVYLHGGRIGVVVEIQGGTFALAKDIAMHIAASRPVCIAANGVPDELLEKEREIYTAQAVDTGKPPNIVDKMVEGRLRKFLRQVTLLGQAFVKDPDLSVEKLLGAASAKVLRFERFEVGEGMEKKGGDFADEVRQQAGMGR